MDKVLVEITLLLNIHNYFMFIQFIIEILRHKSFYIYFHYRKGANITRGGNAWDGILLWEYVELSTVRNPSYAANIIMLTLYCTFYDRDGFD